MAIDMEQGDGDVFAESGIFKGFGESAGINRSHYHTQEFALSVFNPATEEEQS